MIKAYKLFTGADGHSHVISGTVSEDIHAQASSVRFKETPAHSSYDWHTAPTTQYVITLSGTLLFETKTGETFTLKPGDILIAIDTTGSGHQWKLTDDQPWKRAYVTFKDDAEINFLSDKNL